MLTQKNSKTMFIVVGICAVLGLVLSAAQSALAVINPAVGLSEDPVGIFVSPSSGGRYNLLPGSVHDGEFKVIYVGTETSEIFAETAPHSINKTTKQQDFNTETPRTHIAKWVTLDLQDCDINKHEENKIYFTMRPQEECIIKYHIVVPMDAMGGSQDAGIFVQNVTDSGATGIIREYRVGYLIYSDVPGPEAHYDGAIVKNSIPWLLFDPPIFVESSVENTGNLDFPVSYEVRMHNWFGGNEVFSKDWTGTVLADSGSDNKTEWDGAPALGVYKVSQRVKALDQESFEEKIVLIVPLWLIIVFGCVVLLLLWALVLKIREPKDKKKQAFKNKK